MVVQHHHCTLKLDADMARIRSYIELIVSLGWRVEKYKIFVRKNLRNIQNQHMNTSLVKEFPVYYFRILSLASYTVQWSSQCWLW